jgi:hypothetical protein
VFACPIYDLYVCSIDIYDTTIYPVYFYYDVHELSMESDEFPMPVQSLQSTDSS